jgi:hypothetical protein
MVTLSMTVTSACSATPATGIKRDRTIEEDQGQRVASE